jgi:hypothetical protein
VAAEGGRVGFAIPECGVDCLQHIIKISVNVAIPKAQNAKSGMRQFLIAFTIFGGVRFQIVLAAIDLNDQGMLHASEIDYVPAARCLPAEMKSAFFPGTQMIPDFYFLRCQRLT